MNPKVDAFLKTETTWREVVERLRTICLGCGLTEELKWGKPCYTHAGSNVAIIIPLKETCAMMFSKGALLKDAKGILGKPGENTQAGRWVKFTEAKEVTKRATVLKAYLEESMAAEDAGMKVTFKKTSDYKVPAELTARLEKSAALKKAFVALTPGRQRGYFLHIGSAKQAATREARIDKCLPRIMAGKGFNE